MNYPVVANTSIDAYPLLARGKVRDIYDIDAHSILIVTTDRMSAFDVILQDPIPGKGVVLNQLTLFWMRRFAHLIPNHIIEDDVTKYPAGLQPYREQLVGRSVLARKAKPFPVECIVRGYLSGSGWKDYQKSGTVCGHTLPANLVESGRLPQPLFTPSTKAEQGEHDENITLEQARNILGAEHANALSHFTLSMYAEGSAYAAQRGIIIADTKFEFGLVNGKVTLIDEVLTPDSSRFWPADQYQQGHGQPSFDKQYLRDWLETQPWNKQAPAPRLPENVAATTAAKYQEAFERITRQLP